MFYNLGRDNVNNTKRMELLSSNIFESVDSEKPPNQGNMDIKYQPFGGIDQFGCILCCNLLFWETKAFSKDWFVCYIVSII